MINITTLQGAKDTLSQYSGDEYCVIGPQNNDDITIGFGHWLVEIANIESITVHNEYERTRKLYSTNGQIYDNRVYYKPNMIAEIPDDIIHTLLDEGHLVLEISEKEWDVQVALGTVPRYKRYLIRNKVAK